MNNPVPSSEEIRPTSVGMPKSWFTDPFALLDNMGLGYRAAPSVLSYQTLREMAAKNTVLAAIHNTRVTQVANFCQRPPNKYSIGFRVRHKDPDRKMTHSERDFARDIEESILRCGSDRNPTRDDFVTFTKKVMRDRLRYDQLNFEIVRKRNGRPHSFFAVDASTFRINPVRKRGGPVRNDRADAEKVYVQVVNGAVVNRFTARDLAWGVANPRTDLHVSSYGLSEEEQLITTITSHLWAEEWNRKVFSQGSTTKGILNLRGNIPPQQLEGFKRQWLAQVAGVTNAWKTPIVNSEGIEFISLQPTNNEMGYSAWMEYLIKIACAIYLVDPSEINFDVRGGVGNAPMFMTTNEAQQKMSKDRGLQPLLRFYGALLNKHIVEEYDPDWMLEFVGLDSKTEEQAIELRLKELGSYKTLNEVRREVSNLPPVEDGDIVLNPTYVGWKSQQAMAAAQGSPSGPPGAGAPGEEQPPQESLFGLNPEKEPPPFDKEEQHAGAHIERHAQPKKPQETSPRHADWETTSRSVGRPDLRKSIAFIDVEE